MNFNDYEAVWKRQELPRGAQAGLADLRATFESKRRKLAGSLLVRDILEAAAGLLVAGVFGQIWWHIGAAGWPLALAIGLILGVAGFFTRERFRARRLRLGADAPLLAKIDADIGELRHQRRLLLNLWSWYLAPIAVAMVIVVVTIARLLPPDFLKALRNSPSALALIAFYFVVIVPLCFWGAWAINRRVVRKGIEPRLAELEKLRADLLSPTE
jgi:hypothetical protein